jgi:aspartyl aminopeptidase
MEISLEHSPKNVWHVYSSEDQLQSIENFSQEYIAFLSKCKTERETVQWVVQRLQHVSENESTLSSLFVKNHRDKTVFIARQGRRSLDQGLRLIGAHADSPRLDMKQHPLYESCDLALAKTHYYGGIRKYQWLSRPLALHGVVVRTDGTRIEVNLGEEQGDPVFVIADLLPHLASQQNEQKVSQAFEAEKLNIILGNRPGANTDDTQDKDQSKNQQCKKAILQILRSQYELIEEDLYSAELEVVPAGPARSVGLDGSLIGGYGQDDRSCVFCALEAFLQEDSPEYTQVVIFWDKEEIGSEGATGAKSLFLEYTLQELITAWQPEASLAHVFEATKALSADVHGSLDPDYQDLHDLLNSSKLGYGPVFCKFTGHRGKVGANDARAEYVAWLRNLLNQANIPWQMAELGKVDTGGGGTVAKFLAMYGMDIIDFGPGVLGMHSPFEITSKADIYATYLAFREFLRA